MVVKAGERQQREEALREYAEMFLPFLSPEQRKDFFEQLQ